MRRLPYTLSVPVFRSYRFRVVLTACLALAVVLMQGLRVQLHAHDGASGAAVHAHLQGGPAPLDDHNDSTGDIDVSFDAAIKLANLLPWLALVAVVFGFGLVRLRANGFPPSIARSRLPAPPYLVPPGRGPPR